MRNYLKEGTWIRLSGGECYQITGTPISVSSTGLIYPAIRLLHLPDGSYRPRELQFAIKECFPFSLEHPFLRSENGEILPEIDTTENRYYLAAIQQMQLNEIDIIADLYNAGAQLIPILHAAAGVDLSFDGGHSFHYVDNIFTVMDSLTAKGKALSSYLQDGQKLSAHLAFGILKQVLYAVREIHHFGFLHLDIQDSNLFIKGSLTTATDLASIIDLGSARQILEDGKCDVIADKAVITSQWYSAPEIIYNNDGTLQLGPEADLYSMGYLLLFLLTGKNYGTNELFSEHENHKTTLPLPAIDCPNELIDKVHQILTKALAYEPSDRYHTCDEMLYDIYELELALQPYQKNVSETTYDAFVSYSQGPVDNIVAQTLKEQLEHFSAPRFCRKDLNKISQIFIDKGELSSCAAFGVQVREILKNTKWLIVLCSPQAKNSQWVNMEIKTFLAYHDHSHILAVITDGEPNEVFPDALFVRRDDSHEVLIIDVRGKNLDQILKNVQEKELLKIAAPLLGKPYDSLEQRKHTYFFKRAAITACAAFAVLSAFTAYSLFQNKQLNEKYTLAMQNQARYLSDLSLDLYASGDKQTALLTALAAAPKESTQPFVQEQAYALNTILSPYSSDGYKDYNPKYTGETEDLSTCMLSPEGSYVLTLDYSGTVHFLAGDTGKLLWSVNPADYNEESFTYVMSASETAAYLMSSHAIYVVDLTEKNITGTLTTEYSLPQEDSQYAVCGNLLAVNEHHFIYIYDFEKEELIDTINLTEVMEEEASILNTMAFQESGHQLAIGLSDKTLLYSLKTGTFSLISNSGSSTALFTDNTHLAVIHSKSEESDTDLSCFLSIYDLEESSDDPSSDNENGKTASYKSSSFTVSLPSYTGLELSTPLEDSAKSSQLFCWFQNQLLIVDLENLETLGKTVFESTIDHIFSYNRSRCLVGFNNGSVQLLRFTHGISEYDALSLSDSVDSVLYNESCDTLIQLHDGKLTYSTSRGNPDMTTVLAQDWFEAEYSFENVTYFSTSSADYRCIELSHDAEYNVSALIIYDVASNEPVYQYQGDPKGNIHNINLGENENAPYLYFTETTSEDETFFYKIDLKTGKSLVKKDLTSSDITIEEMHLTSDSNFLIVNAVDADSNSKIYLYNIKTEELRTSEFSSESSSVKTVVGQTESVLAVYDEDSRIDIYDCTTGKLMKLIDLGNAACDAFAFCDNDSSFIVLSDHKLIFYDLVTGKVSMKYPVEQEIPSGTLITGADSNYFALKDISEDESGKQPLYLFSVNEDQQISLFAKIDHGNVDLHTMQVYVYSGDVLSYVDLYDYQELTEMAEDVIGDRMLSEEEKTKYYISK